MLITQLVFALQVIAAGADVLPAPTGSHSVGRMTFHWIDRGRPELETSDAGDRRELLVYLFYPSEPNVRAARAPYMPDTEIMRGPWNESQIAQLNAMRAYSRENVAIVRGNARLPLVLLSPGGGMRVLTYHVLAEDLASHGYVVAAIEPPYNARAVRMPDGRVLGNLTPAQRGWPQPRNNDEEQKTYRERVAHWARDMSFVLDQLTMLDRGKGPFARRLDVERVGALGHSRGGQVAGAVRLFEPRVRGGVNLDGMAGPNAVQPVKGDDAGKQPFLWIHKSLPPPPSEEQLKRNNRTMAEYNETINNILAGWGRQLQSVSGGAMRITFDRSGIEHIDFSDESLWNSALTKAARAEKLQTVATTRAWIRAFFDGCLRGEWASLRALVTAAEKPSSGVTVLTFRPMWPQ
ncbi:MAG: alpha/beta hydrolase family protein [Gemmatimonadaceae bacterium]